MRIAIQLIGGLFLLGLSQAPPPIEQTVPGTRPATALVESFDGLGAGFTGPQGMATLRNPSDNSLAVGPDHLVQTVNSRMAIVTKKGHRFDTTGRVLYGPVNTNNVFRGFGGACEERNNGDAVVRYDQLANRWLIVMPTFSRAEVRPDQPPVWTASDKPYTSPPGRRVQPGAAVPLFQPSAPQAPVAPLAPLAPQAPVALLAPKGPYSMCYAISTTSDPIGAYYRYEFLRPLFPDYPRPAVWPDGYYVPTSTGDEVIEKHACVVEREAMLKGRAAREQCFVINDVNFLNNADLDGRALPRRGAPNVMLAAGGTQLKNDLDDDAILAWRFFTNWSDATKTRLEGPTRLPVARYHYLCGGQLTNCVPQPGTDRRLDAQGDKLMARVVYRRIGNQESIVAVHSVNTAAGGGGVRWYEFRLNDSGHPALHQQGTYAPVAPLAPSFRWMASPAIDKFGNIGIGYSFGGTPHFAGQRFAGRIPGDPLGVLGLRETVLVEGEAAQTTTLRWEDYTQTAVDPSDDCTIWYVGDYLKKDATAYSTRIGAFRFPGCTP
ncbi:MAG: hypothetical protein CK533_10240 [Acidobacterium sp.]|nr:MAG: hypothetical protein CK533_10240 [Acidobacterium sp.]